MVLSTGWGLESMIINLLFLIWFISFVSYHYWREKVWIVYDNKYLLHYKVVKYINITVTIILFLYDYFI